MFPFPTPAEHIMQDHDKQKQTFAAQPVMVQRFIEAQARLISDSLLGKGTLSKFSLPDRVTLHMKNISTPVEIVLPQAMREVRLGGLTNLFSHIDLQHQLIHKLAELEQNPDNAISTSASLIRYAVSQHLVHQVLPAGKAVEYIPLPDEVIPSVPVSNGKLESAITQAADAITEDGAADAGRGELQTPFIPSQRVFFLPQWVSFEQNGKIISKPEEAEANLLSMQRFVEVLHRASSIAPYMVADPEYQRKRYGILGQLINQGRSLARYRTKQIIEQIKARVAAGSLNRGLSLSLPYFDDQSLQMRTCDFEVIPAGRIQFIPAFVVRACHEEQAKIQQDTRLNRSTKNHLLENLDALLFPFDSPSFRR